MTIFSNKIEELEAAENVYSILEYNKQDREDQKKYYEDRAKEQFDGTGEEYSDDNYLVKSARAAQRQAELFNELQSYIEKKYLK